jgi:hypothetical protein
LSAARTSSHFGVAASVGGIGQMDLDRGAHLDAEALVRLVDAVDVDMVAEIVRDAAPPGQARDGRRCPDRRKTVWPGNLARPQMRDVVRRNRRCWRKL